MKIRKFVLFVAPIVMLLVFADPALAVTHGGEGLYGPTNDATITNAMFLLLLFFPVLIVVLSVSQGLLRRRHHRKMHDRIAAEAAAHTADTGW